MGRILGIDYGTRRVGLAVTDTLQIAVHGLDTVDIAQVIPYLQDYLSREDVEKVVIGMPSKPSRAFEQGMKTFVTELQQFFPDLVILFEEEDFTSGEANRVIYAAQGTRRKKKWTKELVDKISAVLILQRHLGHT